MSRANSRVLLKQERFTFGPRSGQIEETADELGLILEITNCSKWRQMLNHGSWLPFNFLNGLIFCSFCSSALLWFCHVLAHTKVFLSWNLDGRVRALGGKAKGWVCFHPSSWWLLHEQDADLPLSKLIITFRLQDYLSCVGALQFLWMKNWKLIEIVNKLPLCYSSFIILSIKL